MVIRKAFLSFFCIITIIYTYAMQQNKPTFMVTQISEFLYCEKQIKKQYSPSSPEYKKAIIDLLDTKTYKEQIERKT